MECHLSSYQLLEGVQRNGQGFAGNVRVRCGGDENACHCGTAWVEVWVVLRDEPRARLARLSWAKLKCCTHYWANRLGR
jgi:hypothetical protein